MQDKCKEQNSSPYIVMPSKFVRRGNTSVETANSFLSQKEKCALYAESTDTIIHNLYFDRVWSLAIVAVITACGRVKKQKEVTSIPTITHTTHNYKNSLNEMSLTRELKPRFLNVFS